MPKEAKIFLVDDFKAFRLEITDFLANAGHTVVAQAGSLTEAEKLIPKLKEMGVQVALLDDRLERRNEMNHDGTYIAERILKEQPGIKIVDISSNGMFGVQVHARVSKEDGPEAIDDAVTSL